MTTTPSDDTKPTSEELMQAAEQAIQEKKNSAFSKLLAQLFYQNSADGPVPTETIGYAVADITSKTILIPKQCPKDFFSVRRNTAYSKVIEIIKEGFIVFKGKIPYIDTIKDESDLDNLIAQRIKKHMLATDGSLMSYEAINEKEIRNRQAVIKNKQGRVNSAMHHLNAITQNFVSIAKGFSQEIDNLVAKYPDDEDIKEMATTIKSISEMHFTKFTEFDYVKFTED